jgi:glycosyltransferase involved in cell wall biosynthesis
MTQRLRVAQVITRFTAGAGGVALRGVLALDPDRFEVVFVTGSGSIIPQAQAAGFEVVVLPRLRSEIALPDDWRVLADLRACLRAGGFDTVHTHSAKAGVVGRIAAHQVGCGRIVHTFHGFPFHQFQSRPRQAAYVRIERSVGKFTDAFLAVGSAVAAEATRRRIAPPDRVRTIGVAVETAVPAPEPWARAEARRLLGVPPGMQVVGTVGRLDFQKAPEDFVTGLAQLGRNDVFGVWIGDGPLRGRTEKLAAKRGLSGRMLFTGERNDVSALLPGLDVFAMASRYEGLPCAVVEAMVAALPVVATAVNAVPDIVVAGETGLLVPAGHPELLGRAIGHLLEHPAEAARLGAAGRAQLSADMAPAALGTVLAETYQGPARAARAAAAVTPEAVLP